MSKRDWVAVAAICTIPFVLGLILGLNFGGYMAAKPYLTERAMVLSHIVDNKGNLKADGGGFDLACAVVAWQHSKPVDEAWWQQCQKGFK